MRAAAIFGLGCSPKNLKPFQTDETTDWRVAVPSATDQVDIILLFGGDGTIHRQLSQLVKLKLPVLIVPVGSGNDFAPALGIRGVRDSLAAWRRFCSRQNTMCAPSIWESLLQFRQKARACRPGQLGLRNISAVWQASASTPRCLAVPTSCRTGYVGTAGTR
jgi:hypothetical protein